MEMHKRRQIRIINLTEFHAIILQWILRNLKKAQIPIRKCRKKSIAGGIRTCYLQIGIIYICKGRKYPRLILDSYEYNCHIKEANRTRWRCKDQNKTKCSASLYTSGNEVRVKNHHNHKPHVIKSDAILAPQHVRIFKHL
nr:unnamed protein product [Callosobruchus chinensis]